MIKPNWHKNGRDSFFFFFFMSGKNCHVLFFWKKTICVHFLVWETILANFFISLKNNIPSSFTLFSTFNSVIRMLPQLETRLFTRHYQSCAGWKGQCHKLYTLVGLKNPQNKTWRTDWPTTDKHTLTYRGACTCQKIWKL